MDVVDGVSAKANHSIAAKPSNLIQKIGNIVAGFDKYKT